MDSINAYDIRRVLASNLRGFASRASHCSHNPRQIKICSLDKDASECIANANFCFQIYAIDGDAYSKIRDTITALFVDICRLRKVYNAKNYICGQDGAIAAAKADAVSQINRLWEVINFYNDEPQTTTA